MKLKTLAYTKVFTKGYGDKIIKRATEMGYTLTESKLPLNQEPIDNYRSIPFLMFTKDEIIPVFDMVQFLNDTYTEISAEDFLSVEWPPFTKVLVRDSPYTVWLPNFFLKRWMMGMRLLIGMYGLIAYSMRAMRI